MLRRPYSPPLERIKEEYAREMAAKAYALEHGLDEVPPHKPVFKLHGESPRTLSDLWDIGQRAAKAKKPRHS